MNNETKAQAKEAKVRQPWTAKRVGDILLNNALLIIMAIAVIYIAIKNPNFIKPPSLINILSQTAAYLPAALERDAQGFIVTDTEMRTSIPGIFAAGDVRSKLCRQVITAAGDGATAAQAAFVFLEQLHV